MEILPKPIPTPPTTHVPAATAAPKAPAASPPAAPSAPVLPPHAWENRTFAEMPDRASPEWGKPKPQLTVQTDAGELAKIPKHPAQMTEGELMSRYFDPAYRFDKASGKSAEPFFAQPGRYLESPTHVAPAPQTFPQAPAPARPSPGLWGGAPLKPAPAGQHPKPGLGAASEARTPSDERAPLLPHERPTERTPPPQSDRFAGIEGWGRDAAHRGGNDYYGSDWD